MTEKLTAFLEFESQQVLNKIESQWYTAPMEMAF